MPGDPRPARNRDDYRQRTCHLSCQWDLLRHTISRKAWQAANPDKVTAARQRCEAKRKARRVVQRLAKHHPKRIAKLSARDARLRSVVERNHYTRSFPTGASWVFTYEAAIIAFSVPANANLGKWLLGSNDALVLELSRLWPPDGHRKNLLTEAIAHALLRVAACRAECAAVVSFADPSAGHHGGVYRAASWTCLGRSEKSRAYRCLTSGDVKPRRRFHSGNKSLTRAEIEAKGLRGDSATGKASVRKGPDSEGASAGCTPRCRRRERFFAFGR